MTVPFHNPIHRILTTLLFIPFLLFCLFSKQVWWLTFLVTIVALWAIIEFYNLVSFKGWHPFRKFGCFMVILICVNTHPQFTFATLEQVLILLILGSFLLGIWRFSASGGQNEHSILRIASTVLGVLYIGLPLSLLIYLHHLRFGYLYIIWLIAITWFCDTGAYIIGSLIGKHKLCPKISPNKTIEGAVGGMVFGLITAVAIQWFAIRYFHRRLFPTELNLIYAFGIAISANLGDLAESILKREVGLKDSGNSVPGHGGMLDIIDSLLFTSPVLYLILKSYY